MKKVFILVVLLSFFAATAAIGEEQPAATQPSMAAPASGLQLDETFQKANEWLKKSNLSITGGPSGSRDDAAAFNQEAILFYGEAVGNPAHTPPQKALGAKRAAVVIAQRELAEYINGFALVGDTLVKDGMIQYDVIRTSVAAYIKGAQVVINEYSSEKDTAIAIIKLGLHGPDGFASSIYKKMFVTEKKMDPQFVKAIHEVDGKPAPLYHPAAVSAPVEKYDGLVIDATDQNFRPALINRIFTQKGEVLYDPSKISQKVLVEQGCGEYTNSVDKAKAALDQRGAKNPLVVKATGTVNPSDLQISDDDAVNIFSANQKAGFFAKAKVAFVLK